MSFCPFCARDHDPDVLCGDLGAQALKDAGIVREQKISDAELKNISRKAEKSLLWLLFKGIALGLLCLGLLKLLRA